MYQYKFYNNNNEFIRAILSVDLLNKQKLNNIALKYNINYCYIIETVNNNIITK